MINVSQERPIIIDGSRGVGWNRDLGDMWEAMFEPPAKTNPDNPGQTQDTSLPQPEVE